MISAPSDPIGPRDVLAPVDARMRAIAARCDGRPASAFEAGSAFARLVSPSTPQAPSAVAGSLSPPVDRAIALAAREQGLDPALVRAVVRVESGGDPLARSPAGAQGLMQLMPATARDLGVTDPFDPMQNVRGGAAYLRSLLDRFGDPRLAVAAYNAGPEAVARAGGVPPIAETQTYVARVAREFAALRGR